LIESHHKHKLKKERYESALPKDDELEIIQMSVQKKRKAIKHIDNLSDGAKKLLHMFVLIARRNLDPEGDHYELEHMFDESSKEISLFDENAEFDDEEE